jgi:hypothetical protein
MSFIDTIPPLTNEFVATPHGRRTAEAYDFLQQGLIDGLPPDRLWDELVRRYGDVIPAPGSASYPPRTPIPSTAGLYPSIGIEIDPNAPRSQGPRAPGTTSVHIIGGLLSPIPSPPSSLPAPDLGNAIRERDLALELLTGGPNASVFYPQPPEIPSIVFQTPKITTGPEFFRNLKKRVDSLNALRGAAEAFSFPDTLLPIELQPSQTNGPYQQFVLQLYNAAVLRGVDQAITSSELGLQGAQIAQGFTRLNRDALKQRVTLAVETQLQNQELAQRNINAIRNQALAAAVAAQRQGTLGRQLEGLRDQVIREYGNRLRESARSDGLMLTAIANTESLSLPQLRKIASMIPYLQKDEAAVLEQVLVQLRTEPAYVTLQVIRRTIGDGAYNRLMRLPHPASQPGYPGNGPR